jgi:hypothetical protein
MQGLIHTAHDVYKAAVDNYITYHHTLNISCITRTRKKAHVVRRTHEELRGYDAWIHYSAAEAAQQLN